MAKESAWVERVCQNPECGKTFKARVCYVKRGQYRCCSPGCAYKMRQGTNNHNWKPKIEVECANPVCGKALELPPSLVKKNNYCERKCQWEHQKVTMTAHNNPAWAGGGVTYNCDECGKEKTVSRFEYDRYENHFCGRACHGAWNSLNHTGENNAFYGKTHTKESIEQNLRSRKDIWESEEFKAKQSDAMKAKWADPKYADSQREIISETQKTRFEKMWTDPEYREQMTGENAPGWVHGNGYAPYPRTFNKKLKSKIRKRDFYHCQICGEKEGRGQRALAVHHIDYDKNNNNQSNLISLCNSCHNKTNFNREYWQEYFSRNKTLPKVLSQ